MPETATQQTRVIKLTVRQREVLDALMVAGEDVSGLARRLGVRPKTVANHLSAMKAAAGVPTTLALAVCWANGTIRVQVENKREQR